MPITAIAVPIPSEPALPDWRPARPPVPNLPANDNFPFIPRNAGSFGRAAGRLTPISRAVDAYNVGFALGVGVSTLLNTYQHRKRKYQVTRYYQLIKKCNYPLRDGPITNAPKSCGTTIVGGGWAEYESWLAARQFAIGSNWPTEIYWMNAVTRNAGPAVNRNMAEYWKRRSGVAALPVPEMLSSLSPGMPDVPFIGDPVNPNDMRGMPGVAPDPSPSPPPDRAPPQWRYDSDGQPSTRPHRRGPPPRREKERKTLTRSAKIGIGLYKALDWASEKAELIDALWDALPDDVKKRWSKGRRTTGEQFGQYGTEGADWKAQALWHNWHRVDLEQAARNIIKNYVEDSMIGATQKHMPRNLVNALQRELPMDQFGNRQQMSPEQIMSKWVDNFFDEVW